MKPRAFGESVPRHSPVTAANLKAETGIFTVVLSIANISIHELNNYLFKIYEAYLDNLLCALGAWSHTILNYLHI